MPAADFTANELESGRRLFAGDWQFAAATATVERLPAMRGLEIAFAGRSNVGKSSLINALTGRKALARTSHTPGRTQELIFFAAHAPAKWAPVRREGHAQLMDSLGSLTLVDMPGYGYAQAPKAKVKAWTALIHDYLHGRQNLVRVYVLVDARHGLKAPDEAVLKTLDTAAVSYQVVLTKADQVKPAALATCIEATAKALERRPAAYPEIIATSARTGVGMPELRAAVARLLAERN